MNIGNLGIKEKSYNNILENMMLLKVSNALQVDEAIQFYVHD